MIQVEQLNFRYSPQAEPTLRNITFNIDKGEIFGFLGPSGSGKSTTQKILYKLLSGYSGQVKIGGKNLIDWGRSYYSNIGVCFEFPNHYLKLTAKENLELFESFYTGRKSRTDELIAAMGLQEDINKKVSEYSKGMKMRLNFIRAIQHDPEIIFLDEPTSGLDPINARQMKAFIRTLKQEGKTIFLTTHNMSDADELCDRVALIEKGQIKGLDRPEILKLKYGKRRVKVTTLEHVQPFFFDMENLKDNSGFIEILQSGKINTIHSEEASLEEVFIQLTGKNLNAYV